MKMRFFRKNVYLFAVSLFLMLSSTSCDDDKDYLVTFHTPYGEMIAVLYDQTPRHKENFLELAAKGDYDSLTFHRIMNEFMIQSGDVNQAKNDPNYLTYTITAEFVPSLHHRKGAIGAARRNENVNPSKASSGSQFYIVQGRRWSEEELTTDVTKMNNALGTLFLLPEYDSMKNLLQETYQKRDFNTYNKMVLQLVPVVEERLGLNVKRSVRPERMQSYTTVGGAPHLDDEYTEFGQVVKGFSVIDQIAAVQVQGEKPVDEIFLRISVEKMPKRKITELYGVNYPDSEQ